MMKWEFTETGQPQNDAQGDGICFDINFLLREPEAPPDGGDVGGGGTGHAAQPTAISTVSPTTTPKIRKTSRIVTDGPKIPAIPWPYYLIPLIAGTYIMAGVTRQTRYAWVMTTQLKAVTIAGTLLAITGIVWAEIVVVEISHLNHTLNSMTTAMLLIALAAVYRGKRSLTVSNAQVRRLQWSLVTLSVVILVIVIISYILPYLKLLQL